MAPLTDPLLGSSVLGRYRIVRKLARGGMGAVYLARTEGAEGFARPVVIKRVLPALMDDREVAQMFVREARILSNLQHPGIVAVLDFGQQDDGAYVMVLEYVHGYQLAQWHQFVLRERGPLPVELALHVAIRLLDALHYAHTFRRSDGTALGIVHRDISPSNVLLSEQGSVKLLDFGIARVSGDESEFHTERPRVKGKLPYLPLEVFRGAEASVQGDVYSTAVVLYELLTGTNPFLGRATADIFHKVLTVTPPSVHAVRDDAPERIDEVLLRALSKEPSERHATAAELAAELRTLRSQPEDVTAERLREQVHRDFAGPLPRMFAVEPLALREQAWRNPESAPAFDLDFAVEVGDATGDLEPSQGAYEAKTVQRSLQPEVLAAAKASAPPGGSRSQLSPSPAVAAAATTSPPKSAASAPAPPAARSRTLLPWLIAGLSVGALALAATYAGRDRGEERIVVISRESGPFDAPARPAPIAAQPSQAAPSAPVSTVAAEPTAQAGAQSPPEPAAAPTPAVVAPSPPPSPYKPAAPSPRQLTRAFSRRQGAIEKCFAAHAAALEGEPQLSVHFVVSPQGRVLQASLEPDALSATALGRCLLDAARGTQFGPQPEEVSFHIPITAERLQ